MVSQALRERIGAAAERLGYVPNLAGRTLASRRSGVIGVLVETLADQFAASMLGALERELRQRECCLAVAGCANDAEATFRARELLGRGVEALVAWDLSFAAAEAAAMAGARSVPWLALGEAGGEQEVGRARGAALGCRYLQSLGHSRFAVAEARVPVVERALRRLLGARARLQMLPPGESESGEMREALARMLDRADAPTAIICGSDLKAIAVLRSCHVQGVAVPRQLSVLGFGDSEAGRCAWPALSTLRLGVDELAAQLARRLVALRDGGQSEALEATVKLVVRESTGKPH
jgi:LacI family transcriptional regulator